MSVKDGREGGESTRAYFKAGVANRFRKAEQKRPPELKVTRWGKGGGVGVGRHCFVVCCIVPGEGGRNVGCLPLAGAKVKQGKDCLINLGIITF